MKIETIQYSREHGWSIHALSRLDSDSTIIFVFGASELSAEEKAFRDLVETFPRSMIAGCSSSGEILGERVVDGTLTAAILKLENSSVRGVALPVEDVSRSEEVGREIARSLNAKDLKGIFVLSDGLGVNGTELTKGINSVTPPDVVVTGGLAGDGTRFQETWVLVEGKPVSGYVTAFGFYGDQIRIGHGSQGGWDIFGPARYVTRSKGNILYELDGQPALQLYKEYLGERAADLPAAGLLFPLQIRPKESEGPALVRTILSVDEAEQALIFAGDIPMGYHAQLMRANFDRLIDGAAHAAQLVDVASDSGKACLTIAISCVGRRLVLGERVEEEVEATLARFPKGTQQVGFYSYGEISPYVSGKACELHNQTMTLTTITEDAA